MSSEKGSASASKGGMSNKTAQSSAVVQGIKADQYAKQKLGITTTVAGPVTGASTTPTGFYSTTSILYIILKSGLDWKRKLVTVLSKIELLLKHI